MKANQVTFGVEIECGIPTEFSDQFNRGGYHRGTQIQGFPAGWNCQSDASVDVPGMFPVEVVSPVLKGEAGLVELVAVLDFLVEIGAKVNSSTGLHVHIGINGLSADEARRFVKVFKAFEDAFYSLNGDKYNARRENRYCAPYVPGTPMNHENRYHSLNLENMARGHAEIRVFSGGLDAEYVVAAVYMATSLVARVTEPELIKTSDLSNYHKSQIMAAFIQRMMKGESLVVDDNDPADLFAMMMQQAVRADHVSGHFGRTLLSRIG